MGYERLHGRPPKADDLIAPNQWGEHRNPRRAMVAFHRDLKSLGFRARRQHDSRRTFTSLVRADGGRKDIVDWVTHGPSGSIIDAYTTLPWATLCEEVAKLRVEVRAGKVFELFRAVGAENCDTQCDTVTADTKKPPNLVDLGASFDARSRGLEPLTFGVTGRRSNQLN